jgi:hypothetical protein
VFKNTLIIDPNDRYLKHTEQPSLDSLAHAMVAIGFESHNKDASMLLKDSILVTGSHRSGSTWAGRVLALAPGTRYVQEPFNRETNPLIAGYSLGNMYAHAEDEDCIRLKSCLAQHLAPVADERLIVKDPIALFSAPWMEAHYGIRVVCLVRHPAGFVSSLVKWGWEFHFGYLTNQPRLMARFPEDLRERILAYSRERQDPLMQACLLWNCLYGFVATEMQRNPGWVILRYEDLARAPVREFRKLYQNLNLPWSEAIADEVQNLSGEGNPRESDDPGFKARDSRAMHTVWKQRLTRDQIQRIKKETQSVWKKYYRFWDW